MNSSAGASPRVARVRERLPRARISTYVIRPRADETRNAQGLQQLVVGMQRPRNAVEITKLVLPGQQPIAKEWMALERIQSNTPDVEPACQKGGSVPINASGRHTTAAERLQRKEACRRAKRHDHGRSPDLCDRMVCKSRCQRSGDR